jgi:hypothetical protein
MIHNNNFQLYIFLIEKIFKIQFLLLRKNNKKINKLIKWKLFLIKNNFYTNPILKNKKRKLTI